MAIDASQILGSEQLAGVKVNRRGYGKSFGAQAAPTNAGVAGAVIKARREQKADQEKAQWAATSQTPEFGRNAYVAVTANELALIKLKSGIVSLKLDEVVARVPRSDVASAELGSGTSTVSLTISFAGGETWQLEVPRPSKKHAQEVVHALGGS